MKPRSGLLLPLLVGLCLRIFFYTISDNNGGDAVSRAAEIQRWIAHPFFFVERLPRWGPFHFYIAGSLSYLLNRDGELASRLVSLLAGVLSLGIVYFLTKRIANVTAATLSTLVCALSGLHIGYSTTSTEAMLFAFFLFAGLLGFFAYQESGKLRSLAFGAVCFAISTGVRFEGWALYPLLCLLVLFVPPPGTRYELRLSSKRLIPFCVFSSIAGAWIISWLLFCWRRFGDPLYSLHDNALDVVGQISKFPVSHLYNIVFPVAVLLLSLSPIPLLGAVYATVRPRRRLQVQQFAFLTVTLVAVQYFGVLTGGVIFLARYLLPNSIFFTVLSGVGLETLAQKLPAPIGSRIPQLAVLSLVLTLGFVWAASESNLPYNQKFASVSPRLRYSHSMRSVSRLLGTRLKANDAVVLDDYHWEGNIFVHALRFPLHQPENILTASADQLPVVERFIQARKPTYVVLAQRGGLGDSLQLRPGCVSQNYHDILLACLYSDDEYRVFELHYP